MDDICSPNGCVHTVPASIISVSSSATSSATRSSITGSSNSLSSAAEENGVGSPITITNTVIEAPAATYTVVKEGRVAQVPRSKSSVMSTLFVPYSSGWLLILVALLMGML
jgi:hypothetical protein